MRRLPALLTTLLATALATMPSAHAAGSQIELSGAAESLGSGFASWRETGLTWRHRWAPRAQLEMTVRATERFERRDEEIGIGVAAPLADRWSATLSASASPSHAILPRSGIGAGLAHTLGDGWVVGGALRSTQYEHDGIRDRATAASATLERYFAAPGAGEWRAGATVVATRLAGVATSTALRLQLERYVGEHGRIGLLVAGGREIENLGGGALLVADVASVAVSGRWPIASDWSLVGELERHRFGSRYVRNRGRLGAQLDF